MDITPTRRDSTTSIESASSNESVSYIQGYQFISPETRVLNEAIAGWRDYHGNGRHIVGLELGWLPIISVLFWLVGDSKIYVTTFSWCYFNLGCYFTNFCTNIGVSFTCL